MANLGDRIIVLIDMDCFFCQVESRSQPELQGKPVAVVQYNQWRNGGIIAVNYEARDFGVTRHMRGTEAKEKCADIVLVSVPSLRGKADTSKYRSAGREVVQVLKQHCSIIERASVDEAYLDITELVENRIATVSATQSDLIGSLSNTFVVGYCDDESNDEEQRRDGVERWIKEADAELGDVQARKLAVAGVIVEEVRAEIYEITKFRCSAGISYNKILAKLACGLHKPNRQTILPTAAVPSLYSTLPVKKVRNLGGKFGNIVMESLGCNVMADLMRYSLQDLQKRFDEKTGSWLFNIARGIDNEPVTTRLVCKSIGSSKNFPGKQAIVKLDVLTHWVGELAADVSDRLEQDLEENERRATTLTVTFSYYVDRKVTSQSRSCPLKSYKAERIASQSLHLITRSTKKPVAHIGIAATKFVAAKGSGNFVNFFKNNGPSISDETTVTETCANLDIMNKPSEISSNANQSTNSESDSVDLNFKRPDDSEVSTKLKSTAESFFSGQALSRNDASESSPKISIFGKTCRTEGTETPEKPKPKVESFFAKQAQSTPQNSKANEPSVPTMAILEEKEDSCETENTETSEKVNDESFFAKLVQKSNENPKGCGFSSSSSTIIDNSGKTDETHEKVKSKVDSFFAKQAQEKNIGEPISPSTAILGSAQCKKALNRENFKNSFFMNFLKDSKPDAANEPESVSMPCTEDSSAQPENSLESPVKQNGNDESNRTQQEEKAAGESDLLAQLQEIFPDLDNIDRSVVQLLPIELQRLANTYFKSSAAQKIQPAKNAPKTKSKAQKSQKGSVTRNSFQNFFVKTSPNAGVDHSLQKCHDCNQMIRIEKYAEHKDFHVAQDFQRMMNQAEAREAYNSPAKNIITDFTTESNSLKRRLREETPKPNKKAKTISSFFCA